MDIRQLRYFIAVVEQKSFTRAASLLNIAQPALSLHVRNMEAHLGTSLLLRSSKGVVPTETGEILLRNARIILDQLAIVEEEIRGQENDPAGEVRLGLPGTISQILSVPLIMAARTRYPRMKLRIAEAMSGFVLDWLREQRVDLAILYNKPDDAGISLTHVLDEELVFFGPAHPARGNRAPDPAQRSLAFEDVAQFPLILPSQNHGLRDLIERHALARTLVLNSVIDIDSYASIKELVAVDYGYSILPFNAISKEVEAGSLRSWRIRDPNLTRGVHIAHAVSRPKIHAVAAIESLTHEVLRELVKSGRWAGVAPQELDIDCEMQP
ncbi:LysR substrate-binding domain-containing protein [Microvirga makkahensis]|uniref:LysR family transcriptional regulator n=1 Tax=Microvirga makkahensis TaxID=1128670 RepID=A0A7X3SN72_9HYPH|nr:LysR substrate-binding domain-containing protein [Microvirga makkahensis]MXQ10759.1 LysR family transcriptional regulator [Microvirga makkahensis]